MESKPSSDARSSIEDSFQVNDRDAALSALSSESLALRLQAARFLARTATQLDRPALQAARQKEKVPWVRDAIDRALAHAGSDQIEDAMSMSLLPGEDLQPDELAKEVYSAAVQDVSARFTHELRKIIGRARLHARSEVENYEGSSTASELRRLEDFLKAIETLGVAAAAPVLVEIDLAAVLTEEIDAVCDEFNARSHSAVIPANELGVQGTSGIRVDRRGPTPLLVLADAGMVRLAVANGLRNALEASPGDGSAPVVVTWDTTDREIWVAIIDRGVGIAPGSDQLFEIGTSTKRGHSGVGLATARQAAHSHGGSLDLETLDGGTTRFVFRIPLVGSPA
ncbi:MAG: sensor histidine kinase [Acidimicrobiales bacterium]